MSHFTVLVIGDDVEGQLAPYDEETAGRNGKWDWYQIGGRWTGYFKLKNGRRGKLGESGVGGNKPRRGHCDQARKCDIDFEAMIAEERKLAEHNYTDAADAIAAYQTASNEDKRGLAGGELYFKFGIDVGRNGEVPSREEYVANHTTVSCFAVVKDGEWYEQGRMGFFGFARDEKEQKDWDKEFRRLLADVPDETLLTLVDCHF